MSNASMQKKHFRVFLQSSFWNVFLLTIAKWVGALQSDWKDFCSWLAPSRAGSFFFIPLRAESCIFLNLLSQRLPQSFPSVFEPGGPILVTGAFQEFLCCQFKLSSAFESHLPVTQKPFLLIPLLIEGHFFAPWTKKEYLVGHGIWAIWRPLTWLDMEG